jgi:hypothetical protein
VARTNGRTDVRTVYDVIDKARAKAHEQMGQVEAEAPKPRSDVPNPAADDEARGRMYGMATPAEIRTGRRFPLPTKYADPKGLARPDLAGRDFEDEDRQRGAALTDSEVSA